MPDRPPSPSPRSGCLWRAEQILTLSGATWREGLRRRLVLAGIVLAAAFLLLYGLGVFFIFRSLGPDAVGEGPGVQDFRPLVAYQLLSFGIFITGFLGAMVIVFSASSVITGDAESGLLQTIVVRPVSRAQVLAGRSLGFFGLYVVYIVTVVSGLILLTSVFAGFTAPSPLEAGVFLALQGLVILALTVLASTALSPVATGVVALMAYGLSFIGGVVELIGRLAQSGSAETVGRVAGYLLPSDRLFRMALNGLAPTNEGPASGPETLFGPFGTPLVPDVVGIVYPLVYVLVCFVAAGLIFARKDL
jgi:ABC-type transport system involved in multi-copper enzyme maturation permease subunit